MKRLHESHTIIMLLAFLLSPPLSVLASDWVEDESNTVQLPTRHLAPPAQSKASSPMHDGALKVTDPGRPGSPPSQHIHGSALEGAVRRNGYTNPLGTRTDPLMWAQEALPAPETKLVPAKVFQGWLKQTHPELETHTKNEIVEVRGEWDDSGHVLHSFGLEHTKLRASKLAETSLAGTKIMVVDCAGNLQTPALQVIRDFVRDGGYLITTDWALDGCLSKAIPGYVTWNGGYSASEVVDASIVAPDSSLISGTVQHAHWKLDAKCQLVKLLRADVCILVRSRDLMRDDPDNLGILAVTFPFGKGHVLHLVGHFDNNSDRAFSSALPDPAPRIGISLRQAIAANFVVEALRSSSSAPSLSGVQN